jgi:hypothetical protein
MRQHRAPKTQPLAFHLYHNVVIKPSDKLINQGYYWCEDCKKWVAWLGKKDYANALKIGLVK